VKQSGAVLFMRLQGTFVYHEAHSRHVIDLIEDMAELVCDHHAR